MPNFKVLEKLSLLLRIKTAEAEEGGDKDIDNVMTERRQQGEC